MKALRSRGLVNISSHAQESYSWSAHSLQKLFMEHEMDDQKETIVKILGRKSDELTSERAIDLSVQEDRRVCISLCALYFHKHYFEKTALELGIPPNQLNSVTRSAIEPITRLLALPVSGRWSKSAQMSAKKVYLRYIYGCALHESAIMDLLALQVSVSPMLLALENIAAVGWETPLISENSGPFLKALLDLLENVSHTGDIEIATLAAYVLFELSGNLLHHGVIMSSGILDTILKILSSDNNPQLLVACSNLLTRLCYTDSKRRSNETAQHGRMVEKTVQSMSSNYIPALQEAVLVEFKNLAASNYSISKQPLVNFPGLLEELVNLLTKYDSPDLLTLAAMCIRNLTFCSEDAIEIIVFYPGTIRQLLASMSNNSSTQVQLEAAKALFNLTTSENDTTRRRLVDFPGLLQQLVNLLSKDHSLDLQTLGAKSITNLAMDSKYAKEKIVFCRGAIQQLLVAISNNSSAQVQLEAAMALVNLTSFTNDITKRRLVNFPGLLNQLVNLLSKDHSPDFQSEAAICIRNLAVDSAYATEKIVCCLGAIQQLVASVSNDSSPQVQLDAAMALCNLTASKNDVTNQQLLDFPGLVEELVDLFSRDTTHDLQSLAVCSLRNLAKIQVDKMRLTMMHRSGLLEKFSIPLSNEEFHQNSGWAWYVEVLTYVDPIRGNRAHLHSAIAYSRRGYANMILGQNKESLEDLNRANKMIPGDCFTLRTRCTVRARLEDLEGALEDSNSLTEKQCTAFDLQERGVLRKMKNDFQGALTDLNRSLELDPNDYECLKHRAVVRFLLKDENGAHSDAQMSLKWKPERVDASSYGRCCLGVTSVEFLDYKLK